MLSRGACGFGDAVAVAPWFAAMSMLLLSACSAVESVWGPAPAGATDDDVIGEIQAHSAKADDTLLDLARNNDLGYLEIIAANPEIDPWLPPEGAAIVLPKAHVLPAAPRRGIVINLADQRLYYFPPGRRPETFAIGIGRDGDTTPLGVTEVIGKRRDPTWYPPPTARAEDPDLPASVPPGPDNPLGSRALYLGWPSYLIHGTNRPYGIGRRVSLGCIRLYPEDIESLFASVASGTEVRVVDQPIKVGWHRGELYIEAHPTLRQAAEIEDGRKPRSVDAPDARALILAAAGGTASRIDWATVETAVRERRGVPVRITRVSHWLVGLF